MCVFKCLVWFTWPTPFVAGCGAAGKRLESGHIHASSVSCLGLPLHPTAEGGWAGPGASPSCFSGPLCEEEPLGATLPFHISALVIFLPVAFKTKQGGPLGFCPPPSCEQHSRRPLSCLPQILSCAERISSFFQSRSTRLYKMGEGGAQNTILHK